VLHDRLAAGLARQGAVELQLRPGEAAVVDPGEAEHLRGEPALRIRAPLLWIEAEASDALLLQRGRGDRVGLPLHVDEAEALVGEPRLERRGVDAERAAGGERGGARVDDLPRVGVDRRRLLADRERGAQAV